jgi:6-phosphogluconolactonase
MTPLRLRAWPLILLAVAVAIPAAGVGQPPKPRTGGVGVSPTPVLGEEAPAKEWVFVGTYTRGRNAGKGIYQLELDPATGQLSHLAVAAEVANPSFLAIHPNQHFLYAVSEVAAADGKPGGAVSGFALDPKTGNLTPLNSSSTGGAGPCHLTVDRTGKDVLAANYGGGSVCVLPLSADGKLGPATTFIQFHGSSVNPERQKEPHAHSVNLDAANRFAVVADLGTDKVMVYRFDPEKGTLTPNDPPAYNGTPGAGPRHFAFHPDGKHAYVISELASTITALDYDAGQGVLTALKSMSTLPEGWKGNSTTAEVQVHPSGKFVYGSNRGHNSIAVFTVDAKTGELTPAGHASQGIKTPRNFGIDPTGKYLIAANQDGNSLVVFRIDPATGALTPTGSTVEVPMPVCVKMIPVAK